MEVLEEVVEVVDARALQRRLVRDEIPQGLPKGGEVVYRMNQK